MSARRALALTGALTAIGFALRALDFGQGLWGDELITHEDVTQGFGGMLHTVRTGAENSPPLYFALAWGTAKLGGAPNLIRLPSLIFGTATIPVVALVGSRTVGRLAAVVAAGVVALSPFAIFYSVEARPYATLAFACALSALVLLVALERAGLAWWALYGLSLAAVLYTHYTGVFVVGAELGWAVWVSRRSLRGPLVAAGIAALAFVPWLQNVKGEQLDVYSEVARILGLTRADALVTWLVGLPFLKPREVPGLAALLVVAGALLLAAVGALLANSWRPQQPARVLLVASLAAATPVGLLAYALVAHDLLVFPRNLLASLPFAALLLGWVLSRPPPAVATVAIALTAGAFAVAAGSSQMDRHSRPDYPQVADYVDAAARANDAIVYDTNPLEAKAIATSLDLYYDRHHPAAAEPDPRRWAAHSHSSQVVVVTEWAQWERPKALGPAHALVKTTERRFPGIQPLGAAVYRRDPLVGPRSYAVRGRELVPARGPPLPIRTGGVKGVVQAVTPAGAGRFLFTGWANGGRRAVNKVVVFADRRVVLADAPWLRRSKGLPGFEFTVPLRALRAGGQPTGYAIVDGVAYRLGRFCDPQVKQPVPCRPREPG